MTGRDVLVLAILFGVLVVDVVIDVFLRRVDRRSRDEQERHGRLMDEIRRHP